MEQALPNTTVSTGNRSELGNMCSVQKVVTCQQLVATPGCALHIARYSKFFLKEVRNIDLNVNSPDF